MRICESGEVIEILCGCFGCILYDSPFMRDILRSPCKEEAYRIPYVKYSTGTDKRFALCIVRLGNPIRRPPEGRLDYGRRNDNTHNVTTSFFCATALFRVSSALFFHIFSRKREKIWPAERRTRRSEPHRASGAFEKQQRLHFGYKKPPLRAAFHLPSQQSFAPAGMASSTISRCSFSSPFSLWTAEISIPQDWRPIILRGGRLIIATSVLPTSSSGL